MIGGRLQRTLEGISIPLLAFVLGLIASSIFVLMAGTDPIRTYESLFCEGFGPRGCETFGDLFFMTVETDEGGTQTVFSPFYSDGGHALALVAEQATPLILTALSAAVVFKAGLFSLGQDGQYILGAIAAVFLGRVLPELVYGVFGIADPETAPQALLTAMHLIMPLLAIAGAMIAGAVYSWIAGYLWVRLNVNVLISTIILNVIASRVTAYLVSYPLRSPDPNALARTLPIDDTAWLIPFGRGLLRDIDWFSGARVGVGFLIALVAAALVWFFLWRTTGGYEQRMAQGSGLFARFSGIPNERAALRAMLIGGALAGLAGGLQILGVERRFINGFQASGAGFLGVLVAILARESIPGILVVAPLFAGLNTGSLNLQFGDLPRQLGGIIVALIILFSSMDDWMRSWIKRVTARIRGPGRPAKRPGAAGGTAS